MCFVLASFLSSAASRSEYIVLFFISNEPIIKFIRIFFSYYFLNYKILFYQCITLMRKKFIIISLLLAKCRNTYTATSEVEANAGRLKQGQIYLRSSKSSRIPHSSEPTIKHFHLPLSSMREKYNSITLNMIIPKLSFLIFCYLLQVFLQTSLHFPSTQH